MVISSFLFLCKSQIKRSEVEVLVLWISRLMFDLNIFLIYRLIQSLFYIPWDTNQISPENWEITDSKIKRSSKFWVKFKSAHCRYQYHAVGSRSSNAQKVPALSIESEMAIKPIGFQSDLR